MRWTMAWLGLVACGPDVADPQHAGESSATSDTSSTTASLAATTGTDEGDATTSAVSTSSAGDAAESGMIFDVGASDLPRPVDPPRTCELPLRPNAELVGTTPLGEVAMTAAVFAEDGGGKCPHAYRIVLAPDPMALADEMESYESTGVGLDVVEILMEFPDGGPMPGTWSGWLRQFRDGTAWDVEATFEVTSVTAIDETDAHVEATISYDDGSSVVSGSWLAPYCATVHGSACGA